MNCRLVLHTQTRYLELRSYLLALCGLSAMLFNGCGGAAKVVPPTIAFAAGQMAPPSSVMETSSAQFAAIVSNDAENLGVSWLLTCNSPKAADCGSISRHTASGVPTTYIAPLSAPPGGTVTVVANSSAVPSQSVSTTITIAPITYGPISVAFSPPPPTSIAIGTTISVFPVVTNDHLDGNGHAMGYTLSLTCAAPGTCGFLTGQTYVPPSTVPAGGTVTFTATSIADPTKSASVTVTITPPVVVISLKQLPPASIAAGVATNISATVTDNTSAKNAEKLGVDWSVTCNASACGSFIPQHTASDTGSTVLLKVTSYTAPVVAPPGGMVTVIATSTADPTKQAPTTITITPANLNNGLLKGPYAFFLSGAHIEGVSALAGSVVTDGNGNITAGEISQPGQSSLVNGITGSYFIGDDGRGLITLDGLPGFGNGGWLNGQLVLATTIVDSAHAFIEELDGSGAYNSRNNSTLFWYGRTLRGELELQNPSAFTVPPSGSYAFTLSHGGTLASQAPYATYYGGVLTADIGGNVSYFSMDRYVDGATDSISSGGGYGLQSFGAMDSFGHGQARLGPYFLHYFRVDSGHIIILASSVSDKTGLPAGHMYSQPAAAASLAGTYLFTLAGSTPGYSSIGVNGSSPEVVGGWFACDPSGNLNGYLDTNNNGTAESASVSGTLVQSVVGGGTGGGRWILTLNGGGASQFAVYPTTSHGLLMFQLDTRKSGTGTALVQNLPSATLQGTYAASIQQAGTVNSGRNVKVGQPIGAWSNITGQIIASGSSNLTGVLDIDQLNGLFLGPSGNMWTQMPNTSVAGDFTSDTPGRLTGSITLPATTVTAQPVTLGLVFYAVNNSTVLVLEQDAVPAVGILQLQNF